MSEEAAQRRALRPLWLLTTGIIVAATATSLLPHTFPRPVPSLLLISGAAAAIFAMRRGRSAPAALWLFAGLAIAGGRGLSEAEDRHILRDELIEHEVSIRARAVVLDSWRPGRWGYRANVKIHSATLRDRPIELNGRWGLEIRGVSSSFDLPRPGSVIEVLARVRGSPSRPHLVSASRLVKSTSDRRFLPDFRDRLAEKLLESAGTDIDKIRAAETAAALGLGRRDLVPIERRDRWRRSGLAHVLAVSGLHVGLVGGTVWLLCGLMGAAPNSSRWIVIVVLPAYALLAGAAPSAMRAALMGVIYLGARLIGRAVMPMAAVLLAATVLLLARPSLIIDPGFQLTVGVTAALVRWVPPLTRALPLPGWLGGAVAVPLVAQTAALPLVAWHFRALVPGAFFANLIVLPLIAPTVLMSVGAVFFALWWSAAASVFLQITSWLVSLIIVASAPARLLEVVTPSPPLIAVFGLACAAWLAVQPGRRAATGILLWIGILLANGIFAISPPKPETSVQALQVGDGAAILIRHSGSALLADGGRYRSQAAELMADARTRRVDALLASHTDEDHIGGLIRVMQGLRVDRLLLPRWMAAEVEAVPLLRAARRRGVHVTPVARGIGTTVGSMRLGVVWPPVRGLPQKENERSLVVRIGFEKQTVLITSDIGWTTERKLIATSSVDCDVLIVGHHGSRGSTSELFLNRCDPVFALIPAAPDNSYGHPHSDIVRRLESHGIESRWPARDGRCGALWNGTRWTAFP